MQLPEDAFMLLNFVNMKLRDVYPSLSALCDDLGASEAAIREKLAAVGYSYDEAANKFV